MDVWIAMICLICHCISTSGKPGEEMLRHKAWPATFLAGVALSLRMVSAGQLRVSLLLQHSLMDIQRLESAPSAAPAYFSHAPGPAAARRPAKLRQQKPAKCGRCAAPGCGSEVSAKEISPLPSGESCPDFGRKCGHVSGLL